MTRQYWKSAAVPFTSISRPFGALSATSPSTPLELDGTHSKETLEREARTHRRTEGVFRRRKTQQISTSASKPSSASSASSGWWPFLKYGLLALGSIGLYYLMIELNENPSWWYKSHIKAPYVITPSGRKLAYNEYGNPLGKQVVFVFHDYLAGRTELEGLGLTDHLKSDKRFANVRVIVLDRPGYGQSDMQKHRRLSDWYEDLMRVVHALNIQQFSIIGIGAGALYALKCAEIIPAANPGCLVNVALLAPEAPRLDHFDMIIPTTPTDQRRENMIQDMIADTNYGAKTNGANWCVASVLLRLANVILYSSNHPDLVLDQLYGKETKKLRANPEAYQAMVAGAREAWSQGFHSIINELAVTKDRTAASAVGYSHIHLAKGAHIEIWHGDKDELVPLPMVAHMAKRIPRAVLHVCRAQGHLSAITNNWATALEFVTSPPPVERAELEDRIRAANLHSHAQPNIDSGSTSGSSSRNRSNEMEPLI